MISKDEMKRLGGVFWAVCSLAGMAIAPAQANEVPRMAPTPSWVVADAVPDNVPGATGLR
ncbi:hypothetical protein XOC_3002 [Xanthomonas oryzae pv. oryzicola BLS256]|uniref:Uncharacterized protein n=1 Tax=Xanthomonas oryzae pv. oryzicola (strain BLS256) TaxID=383407 RepID=G7TL59_XANOB|nr:hypothetical protein XOC_3002 [Xanthomonas oryzae pv. oryzicola BLS256]